MVEWIKRATSNFPATLGNHTDSVDTIDSVSTLSAQKSSVPGKFTPRVSTVSVSLVDISGKITYSDVCIRNELRQLIKQVSHGHGGDDEQFLNDYIEDILANQDVDKALICFRDLIKHNPKGVKL